MSSSMKGAFHLGPNYLTNSEIYKNMNFEEIESLFIITQKLIMEYSEEILSVKMAGKFISVLGEISIIS